MTFLQAPSFLPDNLGEWLAALGSVALLAGLLIKVGRVQQKHDDDMTKLKEEMDRRFKDQGERIGDAEGGCSGHESKLDSLETELRALAFMTNTNTQEVSSLRGQVEQLERSMNEMQHDSSEARAKIRERLATVEAHTGNLREKLSP